MEYKMSTADNEINDCRHNVKPLWRNCDDCVYRKRCDELVRKEWAEELGLCPSDQINKWRLKC